MLAVLHHSACCPLQPYCSFEMHEISISREGHYRRPALCRVPGGLPSVVFRALSKATFAECFFLTLGKEALCGVCFFTPGKELLCRVLFF